MRGRIARWAALGLALAGLGQPATAFVPYRFQRLATFQAIVRLRDLATALGLPIDRIEIVAPELYRVTAGRCHVDVEFVRVPSPRDGRGPPHYEPRVRPRICEP